MTIAPVLFKPPKFPFPAKACSLVALWMGLQAVVALYQEIIPLAIFSAVAALLLVLWALRCAYVAANTTVAINDDTFTIHNRKRTTTYQRVRVHSVNLSRLYNHIDLSDGTSIYLPLEGSELLEAAVLLQPENPS